MRDVELDGRCPECDGRKCVCADLTKGCSIESPRATCGGGRSVIVDPSRPIERRPCPDCAPAEPSKGGESDGGGLVYNATIADLRREVEEEKAERVGVMRLGSDHLTAAHAQIDALTARTEKAEAESARLAADLAHMREQAGPDSCADYAARAEAAEAEHDATITELRAEIERLTRELEQSRGPSGATAAVLEKAAAEWKQRAVAAGAEIAKAKGLIWALRGHDEKAHREYDAQIDALAARARVLEGAVGMADALLNDLYDAHRRIDSCDYSECEKNPCYWCREVDVFRTALASEKKP